MKATLKATPPTKEERQEAFELWKTGLSLRDIGERLSKTKNCIAGIAHRERWVENFSHLRIPRPTNKSTTIKPARMAMRNGHAASPPSFGAYVQEHRSFNTTTTYQTANPGERNITPGLRSGGFSLNNTFSQMETLLGLNSETEEDEDPGAAADQADEGAETIAPVRSWYLEEEPRLGRGCRWPLWSDKGNPNHRYCREPVEQPGCPYCSAHAGLAYGRTNRGQIHQKT